MKKVKGLSRIFNVLAYAFLILAFAGYAKFKLVNGNGDFFSIFKVVFQQIVDVFHGKIATDAIIFIVLGVLILGHMIAWFVFNLKRDTKYYTAAIHLTLVAILGVMVFIKWNVFEQKLVSSPKTAMGILICLGGYALFAILAVIFSYIVTIKQVKYEKVMAEKEGEVEDRTPELEAKIRDNQAEIVALKQRVEELENRPVVVMKEEEEVPEEVEEEVKEEVVEEPAEEPVEEVEEAEEEENVDAAKEKKVVIRRSFDEKFLTASDEIMNNYNILRNELISYGVKSRLSHSCDTYRAKREEYAKITIVGKNLKLYLALDPKEFENSTIPVRDMSAKNCFKDVPTMIRIKSPLSIKRAKMLIADLMDRRGMKQGVIGNTDFASQIKKVAREEARKKAEEQK